MQGNLFSPILNSIAPKKTPITKPVQRKQDTNKDKLNTYLNQKYGQNGSKQELSKSLTTKVLS